MKSIIGLKIPIAKIKHFEVTGLYWNSNKRFNIKHSNFDVACSINLWRGSVWVVLDDNTKKLIKRVWN